MHEQANAPVYAPFSWRAALAASLSGGLVFALLHLGLMWAVHGASPWVPVRMIAALVLGPEVLSPLDTSERFRWCWRRFCSTACYPSSTECS